MKKMINMPKVKIGVVGVSRDCFPAELAQKTAAEITEKGKAARGHVFNLGHGITPDVDPEHLGALIEAVQEISPAYH